MYSLTQNFRHIEKKETISMSTTFICYTGSFNAFIDTSPFGLFNISFNIKKNLTSRNFNPFLFNDKPEGVAQGFIIEPNGLFNFH